MGDVITIGSFMRPGRPVRRLPPTVHKESVLFLLLDPASDACRLVEEDMLASARADWPGWACYKLEPVAEGEGDGDVPPSAS